VYRQDIQEVDNGLAPIDGGEARFAQTIDRDRAAITAYVAERNAQDDYPSTNMILIHCKIPQNRGRAIISVLEEEGVIELVPVPEYPKSKNWKISTPSK
jgi:hypothetical protein